MSLQACHVAVAIGRFWKKKEKRRERDIFENGLDLILECSIDDWHAMDGKMRWMELKKRMRLF